jgi:probable phosphoglycerate mutase
VLSIDRRYSGHGDPELTTVGRAQAAGAAARLAAHREITSVLSSPLLRARQTAESVAQATGAPLEIRDGLVETDFGEWEGLTFAEARERDPELHAKWLGAEDVAPPGGESFAAVRVRVADELAAIVDTHEGETVVLVTHVTPIKMILRQALGGSAEILYRLHLDLACLSEVHVFPDGGMCVRLVNDTSHRTA